MSDSDFTDFVNQLNKEISANKTDDIVNTASSSTQVVNTNVNSITNKKLKVLIVSTHTNQINGYSKVIHNIINELAKYDWIKVVHFGTQRMKNANIGRKYPDSVITIDASTLDKGKEGIGFAFAELPAVITKEQPDIVFIYNDITIISSYIEEIRKKIQKRTFSIWAYLDMMYSSHPQSLIDILNRDVERVFCFTKTWKEELKSQGITRPVDVLPHGIDNTVFRTIPQQLARSTLGLPNDITLITSLNRNQPRKRLDLLVMAFAELIVRHPTKKLFMLMVSDTGDKGGHKLFDIFAREIKRKNGSLDIFGNRLLITSKENCYKDEDINVFYNTADFSVSCAEGEGVGLCTFESMACGIPQIVPDINGYSEYCNSENSLMITPKYRYYLPHAYNAITGEAHVVDVNDVADAMERYVFDDNLRKAHGAKAKSKVSEYTWANSLDRLIKRLKDAYEEDDD
jgi:glycosyltransferase involved in cell wall biosynthesis